MEPGHPTSLLALPEQLLTAIGATLDGCPTACRRARLAHPALRAAFDRNLRTVDVAFDDRTLGVPLADLAHLHRRFPSAVAIRQGLAWSPPPRRASPTYSARGADARDRSRSRYRSRSPRRRYSSRSSSPRRRYSSRSRSRSRSPYYRRRRSPSPGAARRASEVHAAALLAKLAALPTGCWAGITSINVPWRDSTLLPALVQQLARIAPAVQRIEGIEWRTVSQQVASMLPAAASLTVLELLPVCCDDPDLLLPAVAPLLASFPCLASLSLPFPSRGAEAARLLRAVLAPLRRLTRLELEAGGCMWQQEPRSDLDGVDMWGALQPVSASLRELEMIDVDSDDWDMLRRWSPASGTLPGVTKLVLNLDDWSRKKATRWLLSDVSQVLPNLLFMETEDDLQLTCGAGLRPVFSHLTKLCACSIDVGPLRRYTLQDLAPQLRELVLDSLDDTPSGHTGVTALSISSLPRYVDHDVDPRHGCAHAFPSLTSFSISSRGWGDDAASRRRRCGVSDCGASSPRRSRSPGDRVDVDALNAIVLRQLAVLPPGVKHFEYEPERCCQAGQQLRLCRVLPALADALGASLERATLRGCLLPTSAEQARRAGHCLLLFNKLSELTIEVSCRATTIDPESLWALAEPMLMAQAPDGAPALPAPECLRLLTFRLPAPRVEGALWARCESIAAAAAPGRHVVFELF